MKNTVSVPRGTGSPNAFGYSAIQYSDTSSTAPHSVCSSSVWHALGLGAAAVRGPGRRRRRTARAAAEQLGQEDRRQHDDDPEDPAARLHRDAEPAPAAAEAGEAEAAAAAALAAPVLDAAASVLRIFVTEVGYADPAPAKRGGSVGGPADDGQAHAEADHHDAAGDAHPLEAARRRREGVAGRAGGHRPHAVADQGDHDQDEPEHEHLQRRPVAAVAIDELREDGGEEDRSPWGCRRRRGSPRRTAGAAAAGRVAASSTPAQRPAAADRLHAEVHEVGRAGELEDGEHDGRALDDGAEPDGHGDDVHGEPGLVAEHRQQRRPPPERHARG